MNQELVEAQRVIGDDVYLPTFIKTCADRGLPIQTSEQLEHALRMTAMLKQANAAATAAGNDPMTSAMRAASMFLEKELTKAGIYNQPPAKHDISGVPEGVLKAAALIAAAGSSQQPQPAQAVAA